MTVGVSKIYPNPIINAKSCLIWSLFVVSSAEVKDRCPEVCLYDESTDPGSPPFPFALGSPDSQSVWTSASFIRWVLGLSEQGNIQLTFRLLQNTEYAGG